MRKSAGCAAVLCAVATMGMEANAFAATSGDANAGDVWVDTVGQSAGPGHEMDPHLPCQNINLWGSGLADTSGTFAIDGWAPSGFQEQDYADKWGYDHSPSRKSGSQVIAVIDVQALIKQAQANGDTPAHEGYHFKLQFSQDPQKHKTFWLDCPAPSLNTPPPGPGDGGKTPPSTPPKGSSNQAPPQATTSTQSVTTQFTPNVAPPTPKSPHRPAKKHKKVVHHKKKTLRHPVRHHKAAKRTVKSFAVASPRFTG